MTKRLDVAKCPVDGEAEHVTDTAEIACASADPHSDYKVDQRGVQGSAHGALLIDGSLACPLIPGRLAQATTGLDDAAIRAPSEELTALISAREPYLLRLKQSPNTSGTVRFQCPAAGTSPSVTCPRFDRLHQRGPSRPTTVDLTDARQRAAHPAAKPHVLPPSPDHKPGELPKICRQQTVTVGKGDLGHLDKFRQDLPYLSPAWIGTYSPSAPTPRGSTAGSRGMTSTSATLRTGSLTAASPRPSWPR
ncbi:hypothetical protein ACWDRB_66720 [Nonomuraea sp. NPDC003707]